MIEKNLELRVSYFISKDKSIRFVPFGYKTGVQSVKELEENPIL